jgi:hypothetical protein
MSTNTPTTTSAEVDAFLAELRGLSTESGPPSCGRLIFALDATASRQPTWDAACHLQADMFREAASAGGLNVQLVYYRGLSECQSSRWVSQADQLARLMERIDCRGGHTQIGKVIAHAKRETEVLRVSAVVFVGDAMEEEIDDLAHGAGELGRLKVPMFVFQEGRDREVEQAFRELARLSGGAYCRFDPGAARQLAELLRAVAVYATGGLAALAARRGESAVRLLQQLR